MIIKFKDKEEVRQFIDKNLPLAVQPAKKTTTRMIDPFKSQKARYLCIENLTEAICNKI